MKNILKYGLLGLGVMATTSCIDTLDTKPMVTFDAETVWGSKATVEGFVYAAYNDIIWDGYAGSGSCVDWEARTPNSVLASQVSDGLTYDGVCTELSINSGNDWGPNRFSYLRRANMIIENVQASSALSDAEKAQLKAHGHFLRGMIFFKQARTMGRFVPVKQVFNEADSLTCLIPLTKDVTESYKYVIEDLKYAADNMEDIQPAGVPTKWAAKVVLSRAALQAYAYTNDSQYLDIALNAAKEVVDNKGNLLSSSNGLFNEVDQNNPEILWAYYREPDNTQVVSFKELMRVYPNIKPEDVRNCGGTPLKDVNGLTFEGWAAYFPTQDLVDNFLVNDEETGEALPWYETSQWKNNVTDLDPSAITEAGQVDEFSHAAFGPRRMPCPSDFTNTNTAYPTFTRYATLKDGASKDISALMYENRDKRFYTAVVYDNCTWVGENVELRHGGNMYRGLRDKEEGGWYNTTTGYYWRKSSIENPEPRAYHISNVALHFNLARVGEAYMNLAEAYLLKQDVANAVAALNATRTVHGGLAPSTASTLEEAWKDYIRERNCELTNEGGDLYFSYLRWGKYGGFANEGEQAGGVVQALNRPVHMIQIDSKRSAILVNQVTISNAAKRVFTTNRYLLPINQSFLNTRETYGIQDNYNQVW